jgi:hypothetical protein
MKHMKHMKEFEDTIVMTDDRIAIIGWIGGF